MSFRGTRPGHTQHNPTHTRVQATHMHTRAHLQTQVRVCTDGRAHGESPIDGVQNPPPPSSPSIIVYDAASSWRHGFLRPPAPASTRAPHFYCTDSSCARAQLELATCFLSSRALDEAVLPDVMLAKGVLQRRAANRSMLSSAP